MDVDHGALESAQLEAYLALTKCAGSYETIQRVQLTGHLRLGAGNIQTTMEGKIDFGDETRRPAGHYIMTNRLDHKKPLTQVEVVWMGIGPTDDQANAHIFARAVTPKNDGPWFVDDSQYIQDHPGLPADADNVHCEMTTLQRGKRPITHYLSTFTTPTGAIGTAGQEQDGDPLVFDDALEAIVGDMEGFKTDLRISDDVESDDVEIGFDDAYLVGTYVMKVDDQGRLIHSMVTLGYAAPDDGEPTEDVHQIPYRNPRPTTIVQTAAHTSTPSDHGLHITTDLDSDFNWVLTVQDPDRGTVVSITGAHSATDAISAASDYAWSAMEQSLRDNDGPGLGSL